MPRLLTVRHVTEYTYAEPVFFGPHRMIFRPRDSHSIRLIESHLSITPKPSKIIWVYDVFGNSVASAHFGTQQSAALTFESEISVAHYETPQPTSLLTESAKTYPFAYTEEELPDLRSAITPQYGDSDGSLISWAHQFVSGGQSQTLGVLDNMLDKIHNCFSYVRRTARGTQLPSQTLARNSGTCRDFALLMIEALRHLGFAARFVSGYIPIPLGSNARARERRTLGCRCICPGAVGSNSIRPMVFSATVTSCVSPLLAITARLCLLVAALSVSALLCSTWS